MKKLLSVFGAMQIGLSPALAVISCDSNKNFTQFKSWVDHKDSFVLYIGADDCEHCKEFKKVLYDLNNGEKKGIDVLKEGFKNITSDWNNSISPDAKDDKVIAYDKINSLDFHQFDADKYKDIWSSSKWMKNIRDWCIDKFKKIFKEDHTNTGYTDSQISDAIKSIITGNGTPLFIIVRNGELIKVESGFTGGTSVDDMNSFVTTIKNDFSTTTKDSISEEILNKIKPTLNIDYSNVNFNKYM